MIEGEFNCTPDVYRQSMTFTGELIKLLCNTADEFLSDETDNDSESEDETFDNDQ